jgi:RNA polymerase sigma-B factor
MKDTTPRRQQIDELLTQYAASRDDRTRTRIIEMHAPLVGSIAHRFARPGVPVEDLQQAAWIALIGALDRFDPGRQTQFGTYAVSCMVGEIKRHFRDWTWSVRAPHRLKEISSSLGITRDDLVRRLQRQPTVAEMAEAVGATEEVLLQAMELGHSYRPLGLDDGYSEMSDGGAIMPLAESEGVSDAALERIVDRAPFQAALSRLDPRKQEIIRLRFTGGWSQQQVADELSLSQMSVSRLERSALADLRRILDRAPDVLHG